MGAAATLDEAKAAGAKAIDGCREEGDDEWSSWVDEIYVVQQPKTAGHPAEDTHLECMVVMTSTIGGVIVHGQEYWEYEMLPVEPYRLR